MHIDTYGTNMDADSAKSLIEKALSKKFEEHDSIYYGIYHLYQTNNEKITIITNEDPIDGEPIESKFPNYKTIISVSSPETDHILKKLQSIGMELLRRYQVE